MNAVYNALLHISAPTAEFISYLNVLCYFLPLVFPLTAYLVQKFSNVSACMILVQLITFVYTTFADAGGREVKGVGLQPLDSWDRGFESR